MLHKGLSLALGWCFILFAVCISRGSASGSGNTSANGLIASGNGVSGSGSGNTSANGLIASGNGVSASGFSGKRLHAAI